MNHSTVAVLLGCFAWVPPAVAGPLPGLGAELVASSTTGRRSAPQRPWSSSTPEGAAPSPFGTMSVDRPTPEGGVQDNLPRASMPEGGVENGLLRAAPTKPVPRPSAPMPEGGAPEGAPFEGADRPTPEGGVTNPLRSTPPAKPASGPSAPWGPASVAGSGARAGPPRGPKRRFGDFADGPDGDQAALQLAWNGYLRLVIEAIDNDARPVGRSDGFKIANARLGLRAQRGDLVAYMSVDAAIGERETFNDTDEEVAARPRDLFLRYRLAEFASITLGRFKAPYDLGQLETTPYRLFIDLPVESRGLLPVQGIEVEGLGQGRQLGAMIHRDRLGLDPNGFDIGYALALTNGRTLGLALNDNDRVAAFGRVSLFWSDVVQVNVAGFVDNRSVGTGTDRIDEDVRGLEVSALVQGYGFSLQGQLLLNSIDRQTEERADVEAIGGHAQIAYEWSGLEIAYRFARYDPIDVDDTVTEHTFGLGYGLSSLPLRFLLNGTLVREDAAVRVDNDRLAFLTQFVF